MKFGGLQKTSLLDYPGRISSVLYTPGCNLRCPFCHNWRIAVNPQPPFLQEGIAIEILSNRKKYVDAVVVSGGEPCMHKELPKFLCKLKEHGFSVKLDTNGFYPEVLAECLAYVDYVAMDIKTSPEKYKLLGASDTSSMMKSVEILKSGITPFEFRTTVVPEIVTVQDINCIGEIIRGSKTHALQQFVAEDTLEKRFQLVKPYTPEALNEFAKILGSFTDNVELRM